MEINGIIAEYNPFHNGHRYQLRNAKEATGADYTIIVMSGNFVQRGAPALINKYKRAEMALLCGADLVLELPMYYATSSAEYFAAGAVSLLDKLRVVDYLCVGSECGEVSILQEIAGILVEEPEGYTWALRQHLRQGISFPTARARALVEYDPALAKYQDIFSSPNNILGIEYLKAILRRKSDMVPYTTLRKGAGYHEEGIGDEQCSAQAIRQAIFSENQKFYQQNILVQNTDNRDVPHMPTSAYAILSSCLADNTFLHSNDFSAILHYKLLSECEDGFEKYLDVSPELSDRIRRNLEQFDSFTGFCDLLKTKDMTYTRISRCLLHILLDMSADGMEGGLAMDYTPYARVLGFRRDAAPLLTAIKEFSEIPLLTKLADAEGLLAPESLEMLKGDIRRNQIYESTIALKSGQAMLNEYRTPLVIV